MSAVLITGIAGTGKSAVIAELIRLGQQGVDASDAEWSEWRRVRPVGSPIDGPRDEWVWRDDRMTSLLAVNRDDTVFIGGCCSTQVNYIDRFALVILLTASPERTFDRLEPRWDLRMAGDRFQRYLVVRDLQVTLPLLKRLSDHEIDTSDRGVGEVAQMVLELAGETTTSAICQ